MLKVGSYKWKEICEIYGWNPNTRGTYKKARLKELDLVCKWKKEGQKIVVEEVFAVERPKKRKGKFINPAEIILLYMLKDMDAENIEIYFSNSKMYKILGMFNSKFEELNYGDADAIANDLKIDFMTVKSFKINSKAEANKIIASAINSMNNRRVINRIAGRIIVGEDGFHRVATPAEGNTIARIERVVLNELGLNNYQQVEFKNLWHKYDSMVKEKIEKSNIENIVSSYDGYCITAHNKSIAEEIDRKCKDENFKLMNTLFADKMYQRASTKHKNAVKKELEAHGFGESLQLGEASPTFLKDFDKLIETHIRIR